MVLLKASKPVFHVMNAKKQKADAKKNKAKTIKVFCPLSFQHQPRCPALAWRRQTALLSDQTGPPARHLPYCPRLAPKIIPTPAASPINPALRKEITITETSELDCRMAVETIPKLRLFPYAVSGFLQNIFQQPASEHLESLFKVKPCQTEISRHQPQ